MPVSDITHESPEPIKADALAAPPGLFVPPLPAELWGLWNDCPEHPDGGNWVCSIDDAPHGDTFLVAFSEREAKFAAIHQNESYGLNCRPVRIK